MDKAFVLSDIHGCYKQLLALLENWDKEMSLFILGDLIDRGEDSFKVVQAIMNLKKMYGDKVVVLMGNHEDMFLRFIDNPSKYGDLYFMNGGNKTVFDFIQGNVVLAKDFNEMAEQMKHFAAEEVSFIRSLPLCDEFGDVVFVHAGINQSLPDWRDTSKEDFLWDRKMVLKKNETGKTIVFGHTPTQYLHKCPKNHQMWISEDGSYIGIDGGCVFGGQLNAIVISEKGEVLERYFEKKI